MSTNFLRTSERNLFKRCQWAWERNYIDRLEPRKRHSAALWFGTGIHLALEHWYIPGTKRGRNPIDTWNEYCDESEANTEYINTYMEGDFSEAVEARELGIDMLQGYLDTYGDEPWMDVISSELTFQVPLKHDSWVVDGTSPDDMAQKIPGLTTTYVGTFDLVYRDTRDGKLYVLDHKTARALGAANTQYLPLDDQAGAYWAMAVFTLREQELIGPDEVLTGIVYNYLVKTKSDKRPRNKDGLATNNPQKKHYLAALEHLEIEKLDKLKIDELKLKAEEHGIEVFGEVSSRQPTKAFERVVVRKNKRQQFRQIKRMLQDLEAMSLVRNKVLTATKTPTRECSFCPFQNICELDEAGRDYSDIQSLLFTTWDPYASHRTEEEAE